MVQESAIIPFLKQLALTLCPALILFSVGAQTSMTPMLISQCKEKLGFALSDDDIPGFVAAFGPSAMLGILLAYKIVNYSRKISALLATCFATITGILTYTATSYTILLCSRVFLGMVTGMTLILTPIYISECASPKYRGLLLAVIGFCLVIGEFVSHIISITYGFDKTVLMTIVFLLISLCCVLCSPESPSLLAVQGKYEECKKSFRWLRGSNEERELEELIKDVKSRSEEQKTLNPAGSRVKNLRLSLREMKQKTFYLPIILLQLLCTIAVTTGGKLFDIFAFRMIHEIVGDESNVPAIIYSIDILRLIATTLTIYVFKTFRRRVLFLTFIPLSISILFITAAYTYVKSYFWHNQYVGIALLHFLMLFHTVGTEPLASIMCGELLSLQFRIISTVIVYLIFFLCFSVHMYTFLALLSSLGFSGTYCLYGIMTLVCFLVLLFHLPETKDRTLLDIELEFRKKVQTINNDQHIEIESFIEETGNLDKLH